MRDRFLIIAVILMIAIGMITVGFPNGPAAILIVLIMTTIFLLIFRHFTEEREFITKVFLFALAIRIAFGLMIEVFELRDFFGGDSLTYDANGARLVEYWYGRSIVNDPDGYRAVSTSMPGWGINYVTGFVYLIFGRNTFAAQSLCAVFGAATSPLVFFCSKKIFNNLRVAKTAAIAVAIFPAFVIWSSQLLKDGLVVFLLVLAMTMVMQLQERFSLLALMTLALSLLGILTLRFYIFYMVAIAVGGSFVVGTSNAPQAIVRRTIALVALGLALMYFGVTRNYTTDVQKYGTLERIQASRADLAQSAKSGFGEDVDVSTTEGAISVVPLGLMYLMLAPFPWQATNLRQAITIPEVLLWWSLLPFLIMGVWYAIKHRLRNAFPVLLFSLMLTIAYSVFQGNVGTAYRQRTQIQVFLFMFIAVGWTLFLEKRENRKIARQRHQREIGIGPQSAISGRR